MNVRNNFAIKSVFKLTLTKLMFVNVCVCVCVCQCVCVFVCVCVCFTYFNALRISAYWCRMALSIRGEESLPQDVRTGKMDLSDRSSQNNHLISHLKMWVHCLFLRGRTGTDR